jgi:uncharacterized LabA/DUF88 family protein
LFGNMPAPPSPIRAVTFFDGQNLFHSAKEASGYKWPNCDPAALSKAVCASHGWDCVGMRFYTGVPDASDKPFWNHFWVAKCAQMGREGVVPFTRPLVYRNKEVKLPDGSVHTFLDGDEKGIDLRIAIDVIRLAHTNVYDVALIFCRDQDFSEVADEVKLISKSTNRWIKVASAYPFSPAVRNYRGINNTQWVPISRTLYDTCLDKRDYRPKKP